MRNLFQYHPKIGYTFIPDIKARVPFEHSSYLVKTNSQGFRCNHEASQKKHGYRILIFGDSYTAGEGVSNKYRFSDLLEEMMPGTEVLNFGLNGTGTDQQYLAWQEFGQIEHDLLVIVVLAENIRRNMHRYRISKSAETQKTVAKAKPYFSLDGKLVLHHVPVPKEALSEEAIAKDPELQAQVDTGGRHPVLDRVMNRSPIIKDKVQKALKYQPFPEYDSAESEGWLLLRAILSEWKSKSSVPVVIVGLPVYQYIEKLSDSMNFQTRLKEIDGVDILPELWKQDSKTLRKCRFAHDQHPTKLAHKLIAEAILPYLKEIKGKNGKICIGNKCVLS